MRLPPEAQTRVDVLRDAVSQLAQQHQAVAAVPNTAPLFLKHADGTVYDTKGTELRGPLPAWPAKGK